MGGGDLNMKKSWHPLLMKNQERVWKEERKAVEERKKTAQLQKELAEERQLQELQRLQAEQGGGRREERVEWLYATPAIGNGVNPEEQEAYLLGKKTVDKLFKEKDEAAAKLQAAKAAASQSNQASGSFISIQNANTARDTASKIREDPLLAIKQQEQLAYENLKKNPARLKALQSSLKSKDERMKEKEKNKRVRREIKEEAREKRRHDDAHHTISDHGSKHKDRKRSRDEKYTTSSSKLNRSVSPEEDHTSSRRRSPSSRQDHHREHKDHHYHNHRHNHSSYWHSQENASRSAYRGSHHSTHSQPPDSTRPYYDESSGHRYDRSGNSTNGCHPHGKEHPIRHSNQQKSESIGIETNERLVNKEKVIKSKAAKLEEMQLAAKSLQEDRTKRLKQMEDEDAIKLKFEEEERDRNRMRSGGIGDGNKARFVVDQEKKVFFGAMDLAERVKRSGGVGLLKDRE